MKYVGSDEVGYLTIRIDNQNPVVSRVRAENPQKWSSCLYSFHVISSPSVVSLE